jgi:hypothetical protein
MCWAKTHLLWLRALATLPVMVEHCPLSTFLFLWGTIADRFCLALKGLRTSHGGAMPV